MNLQPRTVSHRLSTCHRHPSKPVTGFCASCLRERLAGIDPDTRQEIPGGDQHSTSELRRSKSFSGTKREAGIKHSELQHRRSCDVRPGNTLSDLFCREDDPKCPNQKLKIESGNLGFELREDLASERPFRASQGAIGPPVASIDDSAGGDVEFKTMKEFIDLEFGRKKNASRDLRGIAGNVWEAAAVFSKKLGKWKHHKQKTKNPGCSSNGGGMKTAVADPRVLQVRETRSEVGEYGLGRRSCDTDPRLSVDAGRISLDDSRYSFDEPRASWDGCLIGRAYPRLTPMVSVLEEVKFPGIGFENEDPEEAEKYSMNVGDKIPGGSSQTKDYYMDSLSSLRRRRSFDRSNSNRKGASAEFDDLKLVSNAKVSPATTELFYGAKVLITEKDLKDSHSKGTKDYDLRAIEVTSKDSVPDAAGIDRKTFKKAYRWRKVLSVLGMMQKRSESKSDDEESCAGGNVVDQPLAESWQKLRRVANGEANSSVSQKLLRSYSVSCRDPSKIAGFGGNDTKLNSLRRREDFTLPRNRSVRYSPNNFDNGLLRFYLTPLRSYNRGKSGKSRPKSSPFNVKNVM